jgi:mannose-1-phosphate guanylyltransferase
MIHKAVILAAGRGTRLQPLTDDLPKPMIPLLGKPVMEYIVEHLAAQGVREIMVNTSHLAHRIEEYFGDGRRFGVNIGYSFEGHLEEGRLVPDPVGSAGALRKIHDLGGFIDDTTAVLCGDAVVNVDLQSAAARHREQGALATVITREVALADVANYGVVVAGADGRVVSFQEKPAPHEAMSRCASTGIYLVEPGVLAHIPVDRAYDIGGELFPALVHRGLPFFTQCMDFDWLDIGRVADYWKVVQRLMLGSVAGITVPGRAVREGVHVGLNTAVDWATLKTEGPVYIGSGTRIEPGCTLRGPVWIGNGCHIEAGAHIERSVVFDHAQVGANATARELIVSGRYCVSREGHPHAARGQRWWGDARRRATSTRTAWSVA